jgi:hypothetical protein
MGSLKEKSKLTESIILVLKEAATGKVVRVVDAGPNIVTNAGDLYYAQRGAGETPTYTFGTGHLVVAKSYTVAAAKTCTFGRLVLQSTAGSQTYWGRQNFASGYPKTNDSDTDNTSRTTDAVTYKRVYTTAQANGTIKAVAVCRPNGATSSNGQLLNFKTLTAAQTVVKTSSLTLTVYVNHVFSGV